MIDHTHDPVARTWLAPDSEDTHAFALQTLPYGAFSLPGHDNVRRIGVGIAGHILDLAAAQQLGLVDDLDGALRPALRVPHLNALLALTPAQWSALRHRLFALFVDDDSGWKGARDVIRQCLVPMAAAHMHLPFDVGDYTDFYASIHHATNVGTMLRPEQPLLPNYRHVPIGYHGRASSIVVSGTPVRRPSGQVLPQGQTAPRFGPSQRLDYELEVGLVIGGENALGEPVPIGRALDRVFGVVLLNDWSARDIQAWEYQPLGPFLAKSFATTISAWVVPLAALAPRRVAVVRAASDPPPLPYLLDAADQSSGALDLDIEVRLSSTRMRELGEPPHLVSRSNMRDLYWTPAQLVAHHTSNGCNLRPGDLLGTGTVSGPQPESRGCLLERTWRGTDPITLPTGETRRFLEDGDRVEFGAAVGLTCCGEIVPARDLTDHGRMPGMAPGAPD
ncbi:fumarylacetoacetase [Luteitalea pratensis]|uniref:fumarylacetoacetase n=1 Tax=Luteitalea pratensis TaxID=1855912 RepID=A0A143PNR9_LUTPR|nr:fumarylacetoacetase [Luteitalea pratensis]AMY10056.1 fumarylacetoacetase [Luteitalea pratensis]